MADDPLDYSGVYNTPLSSDDEAKYQSWAAKQSSATGRNVGSDVYDYDLRGWWKANPGTDLTGAHLVDQWKKPNHPTFSTQSQYNGVGGNQGGEWLKQGDGSWSFTPGTTNMQLHGPDALQSYFGRVEQGNRLNLPTNRFDYSFGMFPPGPNRSYADWINPNADAFINAPAVGAGNSSVDTTAAPPQGGPSSRFRTVPVEHDPFRTVPVDHDPFAGNSDASVMDSLRLYSAARNLAPQPPQMQLPGMVHYPEPPNPAQPYLNIVEDYRRGGVPEVLLNRGINFPGLETARDVGQYLNNEDIQTAMGMAIPIQTLREMLTAGKSYGQIAEELGVSRGAVAGSIDRARAGGEDLPASGLKGGQPRSVKQRPAQRGSIAQDTQAADSAPVEPSPDVSYTPISQEEMRRKAALRRFDLGPGDRPKPSLPTLRFLERDPEAPIPEGEMRFRESESRRPGPSRTAGTDMGKIIEMRDAGATYEEIGKEVGASRAIVGSRLQEAGLSNPAPNWTPGEEDIVRGLAGHAPPLGAGTGHGISGLEGRSAAAIQQKLRMMGLDATTGNPVGASRRIEATGDEVKALKDAGMTHADIAARLGMSEGSVRLRLQEAGVAPREKAGPPSIWDRPEMEEALKSLNDRGLSPQEISHQLGLSQERRNRETVGAALVKKKLGRMGLWPRLVPVDHDPFEMK